MTNGAYRRLSGLLHLGGRSPLLETDDNGLIHLVTSDDLSSFEGARVVVEGHLSGTDRLNLTWIGRAPA